MEDKLRQFVRKTLLEMDNRLQEITKPVKQNEPGNTSKELVDDSKTNENTVTEKDIFNDKRLKGVDKILSKSNERLS